jgi:hypothetical protein
VLLEFDRKRTGKFCFAEDHAQPFAG